MKRAILHDQIRHRLEDLVEKHEELSRHANAVPAAEMNQFLAELKLVYELALSLHHHNALKSMEDLEVAVAARFSGEKSEEETPVEEKKHPDVHTMDQLMIDAANRVEESKINPGSGPMKITGEVHDKFEHVTSIAEQFKETVTLAETVASKKSSARISESIKHARINDLLTAIGINERFYYIQHLFGGNAGIYHLTLERINKETDRKAALDHLQNDIATKFKWDMGSSAVTNFLELVDRKFLP